jgi:hypothetical protein
VRFTSFNKHPARLNQILIIDDNPSGNGAN